MLLAMRNWIAYLDDPTDVGAHYGTAAGSAICGLAELQKPYQGIPFSSTKTAGGTSGYTFDVGIGQVPVQVLGVLGHNLPVDSKIKFELRSSTAGSSVVASAIVDCISEGAAWQNHWLYVLPAPVNAGFIKFEWLGPDTNSSISRPFRCMRLWASAALSVEAPAPPMGVEDESLIEFASTGQARTLRRARRRYMDFQTLEFAQAIRSGVLGLYDADVSAFEAIAYAGRSTEILAIPRPAFSRTTWTEDALAMIRTSLFGRVTDSPGLTRAAGPLWQKRLRVEEF